MAKLKGIGIKKVMLGLQVLFGICMKCMINIFISPMMLCRRLVKSMASMNLATNLLLPNFRGIFILYLNAVGIWSFSMPSILKCGYLHFLFRLLQQTQLNVHAST